MYFALRLFCALGILLLAGCGKVEKGKSGGRGLAPVKVAKAEATDWEVKQDAVGNVQPLRTVSVRARVDGMIEKVNFTEGAEVKEGDLLVTLDKRPFETKLAVAKADLNTARAEAAQAAVEADRYKKLDQQEVISKEQFAQLLTRAETTKAVVASKEGLVESAVLELGYTEVRAPIAGRTGQVMLHEGALVRANDSQALVIINQVEPVFVGFAVPEVVLPSVREAMRKGTVEVTAMGEGMKAVEKGKLVFVDNVVDVTTGTVMLKAIFENKRHTLWPGQFVSVQVRLGVERGVVAVPATAVQRGQTGSHAFVLEESGKVALRKVKTGREGEGEVVILSGIKAGETVVTDGQLRLVDGAKVQVVKDDSATEEKK